jgi:hypothetical protein
MFRPTWPSSGVYDVSLVYSWRNLLRCFCCLCCTWLYYAVSHLCFFVVFSLVSWFLCACLLLAFLCCLSGLTTCNKGNKSSEEDSFRNIKVKHHTHLKMAETCSVEQLQLNVRQWIIYNKAARRRQHKLKTYWTIQCSRMLKYNVIIPLQIVFVRKLPQSERIITFH